MRFSCYSQRKLPNLSFYRKRPAASFSRRLRRYRMPIVSGFLKKYLKTPGTFLSRWSEPDRTASVIRFGICSFLSCKAPAMPNSTRPSTLSLSLNPHEEFLYSLPRAGEKRQKSMLSRGSAREIRPPFARAETWRGPSLAHVWNCSRVYLRAGCRRERRPCCRAAPDSVAPEGIKYNAIQ